MAKAGTPSTVAERGGGRSAGTRRLFIDAAIETLKAEGFAGASARTIAERAGSTQGLIFYHFGSVANLLLAALDAVSDERLHHYRDVVAAAHTPSQLAEAAKVIFRKDLDAGHITVLVEMIAGASSTPGLSAEVAARIEPWREFAQTSIEHALGDSPLTRLCHHGTWRTESSRSTWGSKCSAISTVTASRHSSCSLRQSGSPTCSEP